VPWEVKHGDTLERDITPKFYTDADGTWPETMMTYDLTITCSSLATLSAALALHGGILDTEIVHRLVLAMR
jgi:hypothetical protein